MKVLGITGSLRKDSHNSLLLSSASRVMPVDAELVELDVEVLRQLPHYDEDLDVPGLDNLWVRRLREEVSGADALLFVTPEYNGGLPSAIKNAVDWVSRPRLDAAIKGKPSAALSASPGQFGGVWAQDHLRKVLAVAGARVIDAEFAVARAHEVRAEYGDVLRPDAEGELAEILEALVEQARINVSLVAAA
ncbi:MAG: NAD(P)H-dependent oxidoreductase [Thermoleophilaceae bacterium]|nr:NAD(P)H-dependent oxidoreductase [Thermoleophilaceae bacterium]